ncbi:MAG: O-antigen ligase family protein [Caulobacter sp.]|nr:O-antigen ligase family protein [Caulobacter sp.]
MAQPRIDWSNQVSTIRGLSLAFWLTAAVLALALVFGGASRENTLQVMFLELASLPLLAHAAWRYTTENRWESLGGARWILMLLPAIPLLQLLPVPFGIWVDLPGHAAAASAARLAGLAPEWRPISLAPLETWRSMLALIPPAAIFLGAALTTESERRWLCVFVPVVAIVSLAIGALQLAGGDSSPLYFYKTTNQGSPVGLFSNRNHQASLLVMSLPFAALWLCRARPGLRESAPTAAALVGHVVLMVVGLVIVGSRAGALLAAPALVLVTAMLVRAGRLGGRISLVVGGLVLAVSVLTASFVVDPLLERFSARADQRFDTAPVVAATAWRFQPTGAGIGSFPSVYAGAEPVELMAQTYFNHAHNDYLEIWLETGVLGVMALLSIIAWWVGRSYRVWTLQTTPGRNLARAGSAAIALLLVHSLVDYPVRTLAIAAVLALSCALLAGRPTDFSPEVQPTVGTRGRRRPT